MKYVDNKIYYEGGDWVKLVSSRPVAWNPQGMMDNYLGAITQITHLYGERLEIDAPRSGDWEFRVDHVERLATQQEIDKELEDRIPAKYRIGTWVCWKDNWFQTKNNLGKILSTRKVGASSYVQVLLTNGATYEGGLSAIVDEATSLHIENALTTEAIKKGYTTGALLHSKHQTNNEWCMKADAGFKYYKDTDTLMAMFKGTAGNILPNCAVYTKGEWVKIIERPIYIGKHLVVFEDEIVRIGCVSFSTDLIENLFSSLNLCGVESIVVQGISIPLDTIARIYKKLEDKIR